MKDSEELFKEIHANVIRDRKRLEMLCDAMANTDEDMNPLERLGMVENITKLSEALTKSNAQLVELAKMKMKKEFDSAVASKGNLSESETEDLFNNIGDSFNSSKSRQ